MIKRKENSQPIKAYVRVRPVNDSEGARGSHLIVDCKPNCKDVIVNEKPVDKITRKFTFDRVFGPDMKQLDVYRYVASPLIKEVLKGYNCTIFAYGQTGAGKTYTMEGNMSPNEPLRWNDDSCAGIIPRAICHLFDELRVMQVEYSVKASFLELYNEELFDLLSSDDDANKLRIFEDAVKKGSVIVQGLDQVIVRSKEEVYTILEKGSKKRQTASTLMNASSSRSHTVFSITVRIKETVEDEELVRTGKLNLVDLAGSENIERSGAVEKRAREAGNINQSLLTLGRVINSLVERRSHIPYRESKLTRILQDSLGGHTKTCIIAAVSPCHCNLEETLSTLDYAHRAKNILNKPEVNQKIGKVCLIKEYLEEIQKLKSDLTATRQKNGIYVAEENYNEMMAQIDRQKQELSMLLIEMKSVTETLERKEELNRELSESLALYQNKLSKYKEELKKTNNSLEESNILLKYRIQTEDKLSTQAQDLLKVADTATNDVRVLQDTLGRKRNLEANNLAACKNVANLSKEKLSSLNEHSLRFKENRLKSNQEMMQLIEKAQNIADSRTQEMKDNLDGAVHNSNDFINKLRVVSKDFVSESESMSNTTKSAITEMFDFNVQSVLEFVEDITRKIENVAKELSVYKVEQQNSLTSLLNKIEEQERDLRNYLQFSSVFVNEAEQNVKNQERVIEELKCASSENKKVMDQQFTASMDMLQEIFQECMDSFDDEEKKLESSLSTLKCSSSDLENLTSELNNMKCYAKDNEAKTLSLLIANNDLVAPCVDELGNLCLKMNERIEGQTTRFSEIQEQCLSNVVNNLSSWSSVVKQFDSDLGNKTKELQSCIEISTENLKTEVENAHELLTAVNEECRQHTVFNCEKTSRICSAQENKISECADLMQKFIAEEIVEDVPSGNTPRRQEFVYPQTLAATSPHERILARHRTAKSGIEKLEETTMVLEEIG